jgi:putative ABC transport system permease protein
MLFATAPWRRALGALRRQPGLLVMTMAAGLIVGIVATSAMLFVDTAGSGAVQVQWERGCPSNFAPNITWRGPLHATTGVADDIARSVGGFGTMDTTISSQTFVVSNGDVISPVGLLARSGFRDHIEVVAEAKTGDVWLPDTLAARLGVSAGSTVVFGASSSSPNGESTVVRGVYRDLLSKPFDDYWCSVANQFTVPVLSNDAFPPPRALLEPDRLAHYSAIARTAKVIQFMPFASEPLTLAQARSADRSAEAFTSRLITDGPRRLAEQLITAGPAVVEQAPPKVVSDIDRLTVRAAEVRRAVADAVRPVALLATGSGLALASIIGLMWLRVKRNDAVALATFGLSPAAIGSKASMESLVPMLVGACLGAVTARFALAAYAPATDLEPGTFRRAVLVALAAAAVASALAGVAAAVGSRSLLGNVAAVRRSRAARAPWELIAVVAAVVSWSRVREGALVAVASSTAGSSDVAGVSTAALTFPLLVFVAGALITRRVWSMVLGRRGDPALHNVPVSLAGSRLRHQVRSGAALVACGTVAIAISVYGAGLVSSLSRTSQAKAGLFVGSDNSFRIAGDLPTDTPDATQVLRRDRALYAGKTVDILAVDPATFERAAFWDSSLDERSLGQLVAMLTTSNGLSGVIAVGDVASAGVLGNTEGRPGQLQVRVARIVDSFPGAERTRPTIVLSTAEAAASGFKFSSEAWTRGNFQYWSLHLAELGAKPVFGVSAKNAIDASTLLFASWAFEFVRALGAFIGLQVVIALLLQIASRQRKQALGFGFLQRMGLRGRTHWRALVMEVAAYATAMLAAGIALALVAIAIVGPNLDPLPTSPPDPLLVLPRVGIAAAVLAAAATAVFGTFGAQRLSQRMNLAEALRSDD